MAGGSVFGWAKLILCGQAFSACRKEVEAELRNVEIMRGGVSSHMSVGCMYSFGISYRQLAAPLWSLCSVAES